MIKDVQDQVLEEKDLNRSKLLKMPVCLCINGTRDMKTYEYDLGNSIKNVLSLVKENDLQKFVDMGIISYSDCTEIKPVFKNVKDIKEPKLDFSGRESDIGECMYTVLTEISKKCGDYRINGNNYCKPVIILITSAEKETITDKTKQYILEKRRNNAVYIISVIINSKGETEELKTISDRVLKGESSELLDILSAIVESMEHQSRSSTSSAYEELLDPSQKGRWSKFLV